MFTVIICLISSRHKILHIILTKLTRCTEKEKVFFQIIYETKSFQGTSYFDA